LSTTAFAAGVGGLVGVVLAFVVAYVAHRSRPLIGAILRGSTLLKLAMPGIVGSLALVWAVTAVPGIRQIYGTLWLLLLAFIVSVLTVSVQIASTAVRQVSTELEDAARVSGASELRVIVSITGRLLLPSLLYAWFLAAIMIVGDLDAPLLLSSAGTRTVSIQIYRLFDGTQESQAAALLTLILAAILLCTGLHALLQRLSQWRSRRMPVAELAAVRAASAKCSIAGQPQTLRPDRLSPRMRIPQNAHAAH
jgi:iron(III) transport system permease protein